MCLRKKSGYSLLICAILLMQQISLYAMTIEDEEGMHFLIEAPQKAHPGEAFAAVVSVYDAKNNLIQDYDKFGADASIITTGSGTITPKIISASSFKQGKATVYLTYDKSETFEMSVESIPRKQIKGTYLIGTEDTLEISVWQAEGLTKEVMVSPDGTISFPLIGELKAADKTLGEFDKEVTQAISEYVKDPQVSIMVKKVGGKRIIIFGEVKNPGVYHVTGQGTIMEVIAMAGGYTEDAVTNNVVILSGDLITNPDVRMLNLAKLITNKDRLSKDYFIEPNDIVYVPERLIPSINYIIKYIVPNFITSAFQQSLR